jgi:hypothetical protein
MKLLLALLLLVLPLSCGKSSRQAVTGDDPKGVPAEIVSPPPDDSRRNLFALLRTGEHPLWFEFSGQGPRLIDSPGEAEAVPFVPWPLARHVRDILSWEGEVFFAVNRDGLLAALPREEPGGAAPAVDIALYRIPGDAYWQDYTIAALFPYDGRPALLFYRDDRFAEPVAAPPEPPVLCPQEDFSGFTGLKVPALEEDIPFAQGWEADLLRPGADGRWYYRGVRRTDEGRDVRYFRTGDLSRKGEGISAGIYRDSQAPVETGEHVLPVLPEGFVFTGFAWLGDTLFASWEEQEDYNIGAAGFMALRPNP